MGDGTFLFLVGENIAERDARMIIDGDMDILPAGRRPVLALIALPCAIAGNAVADLVETAKFLNVYMDYLAWRLAFITRPGRLWLQAGEQGQATPFKDAADRCARQPRLGGDLVRRVSRAGHDV